MRGARVLLAILAILAAGAAAEEAVVNVYNWTDYIAPATVAKFTAATGIRVRYDLYDSNEMLDAKLAAGRSGYDVVFPSASPFFAQQVKAGALRPLDRSLLPHAAGIAPSALADLGVIDPGNRYGVPYLLYATGFAYDVGAVARLAPDAPTASWAMLFDPKVTGRLAACGVSVLDTPSEVVPAALIRLGRDPRSQSIADLDAAMAMLATVRGDFRAVNSARYINDLAGGELCVAMGWIGDLVQARERARRAGTPRNIAIVVPVEGAQVNIDVMAIPADAPHVAAAHAFIDFLLRPEIIAEISNHTGYANAVPDSAALLDAALRADPAVYPPTATRERLFAAPPPASAAYERARARAWARFRASKSGSVR